MHGLRRWRRSRVPALKRQQKCLELRLIAGLDDYVINRALAVEAIGFISRFGRALENLVEASPALLAFNRHVAVSSTVLQIL